MDIEMNWILHVKTKELGIIVKALSELLVFNNDEEVIKLYNTAKDLYDNVKMTGR